MQLIFLMLVLMSSEVSASPESYTIAPVPAWVKPITAFASDLEASSEPIQGYHARLQDFQYNGLQAGQRSIFSAREYRLTNRYAVKNHSSIEISFDPGYEALSLHELWIKRGNVLIDKLPTARLDLLQTDSNRDELVYDGTRTLAIVLDDIRPGDSIRYSYSIEGENPIFAGNREFQVSTEMWRPLDRNYTRILTSSDRPLSRRVRGTDVALQISNDDGIQELVMDQRGVPEFRLEADVPSWHYNRGTVVFSDMTDWGAVVDWALPMYQLSDTQNHEIATIASVIRSSWNDARGQIGAALRWVQEEVRYVEVELGKNSHWPSPPHETLARQFGDCKDKSLLLIALLKELGVEAQAALVNTHRGLESANYPHRLHAFNHVLVHVKLDDEVHFLDPGLRNQAGDLGELREPDYGRALVLLPGTTTLSTMSNRQIKYRMAVHKTLLPNRDAAELKVVTNKRGSWAENLRDDLESKGPRDLAEVYHAYYADYFDDIVPDGQPEFFDGPGGAMVLSESYRIPALWLADENLRQYRRLYADEIQGYLDLPERTEGRLQPYEVVHPIDIEERWDVFMSRPLQMDDLEASVDNEWFSFTKKSEVDKEGRLLSVGFRYRTHTNEVAAADLSDYAAAVSEVYDLASFYIEKKPSLGTALKEAVGGGSLAPHILVLFIVSLFWRQVHYRS